MCFQFDIRQLVLKRWFSGFPPDDGLPVHEESRQHNFSAKKSVRGTRYCPQGKCSWLSILERQRSCRLPPENYRSRTRFRRPSKRDPSPRPCRKLQISPQTELRFSMQQELSRKLCVQGSACN